MPPVGVLTFFLLFVTASQAQEKSVEIQPRCGASFTEAYKPIQIQVNEDSDCTWDFVRPNNETTRIVFSVLNLNPVADCSQENITVFDENLDVLGVLCPDSPRIAVFETTGSASVRVSTNSESFQRNAYVLYYSFPIGSEPANCGGDLRGFSGTIASPNYPGRHPHFAYCIWHLEVPKNTKIDLTFTEIFLEIDPACRFDFIALYDGPSTSSPLLDVLCGRTVAEVETTSNSLTLLLSTDYANSYYGFSANYVALPKSNTSALSCSGEEMTVIIDPSYITSLGYDVNDLALSNASCVAASSNPVVFNVPFSACGTVKKVDDHIVSYTNIITASPGGGVITRRKQLQIIVTCELDNESAAEIMYVTENDIIQDQQETGKYDVSLSFYESQDFNSPVLDSPYFVELNNTLFLQATLKTNDPELTVFTDTCFASSKPDFTSPNYDLIRNGCLKDDTFHNFPSGSGFSRFSFSAFKFLQAQPSVYLQCRVVICDANDSGSRCNQGCITRKRRDLGSNIRKAHAVVGPIRLKRQSGAEPLGSVSEKNEDGSKAEQSTFYLFGILVLVANVLIVAFVVLKYSRKQPSTHGYLPVPTS
ncbi:CUB and zona pellucida-like domain-containing protein 1 [Spea bombifrons]|uniref:CUB and zona pellucida-like domain-containing protein 1 n=1 Tax=Spea bombifrons TaxID=233779 RepID=UPI00234A3E28|nr:CUB and zona pellucida-like domain-containing protein 1 [Spea bombifrons]